VPDNINSSLLSLDRAIKWAVPLLVFLISGVLAILVSLAFGWLPGVPDSTQRSLPIYYQPGADKAELSVYVHPPMSTIQVGGDGQRLAFEFSNKSKDTLTVSTPTISPPNCFKLDPIKPLVVQVEPDRSVAAFFDLKALDCIGQFPLIFQYTWKAKNAPPNTPESAQSISTGPIRVTSKLRIRLERLVGLGGKIFSLFVIPLFLAGISLIFQRAQDKKAELQKKQEQTLEVWKTILPGIIQAIRDHYIPILRTIAIMNEETSKTASTANGDDILTSALLLRRKITYLTDTSGGFYFRNNRGEVLCASLANLFMARCYVLSGDKESFHRAAETLAHDCTLTRAKSTLRIDSPLPGTFRTMCTTFKSGVLKDSTLKELDHHLEMIYAVLIYEANGPFYPWWYDEKRPTLDETKLSVSGLGLTADEQSSLQKKLDRYLESLKNPERN
jgi:hypothetical protein